jgi:acetyl-CoA decarbonylase/synthase complex subunit gamma
VSIGVGDYAVKVGGETVLFRHEKTFVNPPGLACMVSTDEDEASIEGKVERFKALQFERVGLNLRPEMFCVKDTTNDPGKYKAFVEKFMGMCDASLILFSPNPEVMEAALEVAAERKPLIYAITMKNGPKMAPLAQKYECPAVIRGDGNMDTIIKISENLAKMGLKDLVIDTGTRQPKRSFLENVVIRRAALQDKMRPLGFPTISFACEMAKTLEQETMIAAMGIAKYAGLIVVSDFKAEHIFPLLLERLNIYTDPQRPMTAEQGIYPIGNPDENSPVLVTCNFSLTYFIVSGEIESSRIPSWLCVQDTEGLSVMTAWAAGKFSGESVGTFISKSGITDKVNHKNLVIPGYAAGISGELEEELSGWKIIVGPREASQIPKFLKSL